MGTEWSNGLVEIEGVESANTDNISFLDLDLAIGERIKIQLKNERYYYRNLPVGNKTFLFSDFLVKYKPKEIKFNLSFSINNIFDTHTYGNYSISDISTSSTTYRLLPRYFMLKVGTRF